MTIPNVEKLIAVKLNADLTSRLDSLAKRAGMLRAQLMLNFVNIWINVIENSKLAHVFYTANLLRVHEAQMNSILGIYEHEFSGSRITEKPIPIKMSESDIFKVSGYANKNHLSRHQMLKTMIIVGIEELEKITSEGSYQYGSVEPELHNAFCLIMKKGYNAYKAYIK